MFQEQLHQRNVWRFFSSKNAVYTESQGASLVWEQKRDKLKDVYYYVSLDEKNHLWTDNDGNHGYSRIDVYENKIYEFHIQYFEIDAYDDFCLMCFTLE